MTAWNDNYWKATNVPADHLCDMIRAQVIDVNKPDSDGDTLLHKMAICGRVCHILLLIKEGAAVDAKNDDGKTPLVVAIDNSQFLAAIVLAKYEKNINDRIFGGRAVLHIAVEAGNVGFAFALIKAGADVNAKNKDGKTALEIAEREYGKAAPQDKEIWHNSKRDMVYLLRLAMKGEL